MTGLRLTFECTGQKTVERELLRVGAYAGDASPAFSAIADLMTAETKEQFDTQGGHASGGWKPLKEATLAEKVQKGYPSEILRRTDTLLKSLTVPHDPNQIRRITPLTLEWGSRVIYAGFHQTGTTPGPGRGHNLPRRAPVAFTEPAKRAMTKILQRWVITGELA